MGRKALAALVLGTAFIAAAFSQDADIPRVVGLGFSKGVLGVDSAYTLDVTSPYFSTWGNPRLAFRLSGDVMAKEGVLSGSNSDSIVWPAYFSSRLGLILATIPNGFMRLYTEGGGMVIFPTSALMLSPSPSLGFFLDTGVEFFLDDGKHATMFLEIGNEMTFGRPCADRMQNAPILGNGLMAIAGVRYYF